MKDVIKQTQGNRKLRQYIEDLSNNKNFLSLYKHIVYKSDSKRKNELLEYAAEKYGIDFDLFQTISRKIEDDELLWGDRPDVCEIEDDYDEIFNTAYPYISPKKSKRKQLHTRAYPLSIKIHKLASKRDILDFIEKRWDIIDNYIEDYRKKTRIRKRKNQKMYDFIWDIHEKSSDTNIKKLKEQLDEKYPNNNLAYFELYKIISLEKQRRNRDAGIGF